MAGKLAFPEQSYQMQNLTPPLNPPPYSAKAAPSSRTDSHATDTTTYGNSTYNNHNPELPIVEYTQKLFEDLLRYVRSNEVLSQLTTDVNTSVTDSLQVLMIRLMNQQGVAKEPIVESLYDTQTILVMLESINTLIQSEDISDTAKSLALKQLCCQGDDSLHFKVNQIARANITLVAEHTGYTEQLQSDLSQQFLESWITYVNFKLPSISTVNGLELALKEELGINISISETSQLVCKQEGFSEKTDISDNEKCDSKALPRRSLTLEQREFLTYMRNRISPVEILRLLASEIKNKPEVCKNLDLTIFGCKAYPAPKIKKAQLATPPISAALLTMPQWSKKTASEPHSYQHCKTTDLDTYKIRFPTSMKQLAMPAPFCFTGSLTESSSNKVTVSTSAQRVFSDLSESQIHYCLAQNILARRANFSEIVKVSNMDLGFSPKVCGLGNLYYCLAGPSTPSVPEEFTIEMLSYIDLQSLPEDVAIAFLAGALKKVDDKPTLEKFLSNSQLLTKGFDLAVEDALSLIIGKHLNQLERQKKISIEDIKSFISNSKEKMVIFFLTNACSKLQTQKAELVRVTAIFQCHKLGFIKPPHTHGLNLSVITSSLLSHLTPEIINIIFTPEQLDQRFYHYCQNKNFALNKNKTQEEEHDVIAAMRKLLESGANCQAKYESGFDKGYQETSLITAIRHRNYKALQVIIEHKKVHSIASIPSSRGFYPLHYAAVYKNNIKAFILLVNAGEDINQCRNGHWFTPMHAAISHENLDTIKYIFTLPSFNKDNTVLVQRKTEMQPLPLTHYAAEIGSVEALKFFISEAGVPEQLDLPFGEHQFTPYLHSIAANQPRCMKILESAGAKTNSVIMYKGGKYNSLTLAALYGHTDLVKSLMNAEWSSNKRKQSALIAAVESQNEEVLKQIINQLPTNLVIPRINDGERLYCYVARHESLQHLLPILQTMPNLGLSHHPHSDLAIAKMLPATRKQNIASLYDAVAKGDLEATEKLLATLTKPISLAETNSEGKHILQVAIDSGHHHLIPILAKNKDVPKNIICQQRPEASYPILHYVQVDLSSASQPSNKVSLEHFQILVSHCSKGQLNKRAIPGPKLDSSENGLTALHFALVLKQVNHAMVLIQAGADKHLSVNYTSAAFVDCKHKTPLQIAHKECLSCDDYFDLIKLLTS